jgi:hypothetical protein
LKNASSYGLLKLWSLPSQWGTETHACRGINKVVLAALTVRMKKASWSGELTYNSTLDNKLLSILPPSHNAAVRGGKTY